MFKVKYNNYIKNDDLWLLVIDHVYNCEIVDGKYIVYDSIVDGNNVATLSITFTKSEFKYRFIDLKKERKLKLNKINDGNIF